MSKYKFSHLGTSSKYDFSSLDVTEDDVYDLPQTQREKDLALQQEFFGDGYDEGANRAVNTLPSYGVRGVGNLAGTSGNIYGLLTGNMDNFASRAGDTIRGAGEGMVPQSLYEPEQLSAANERAKRRIDSYGIGSENVSEPGPGSTAKKTNNNPIGWSDSEGTAIPMQSPDPNATSLGQKLTEGVQTSEGRGETWENRRDNWRAPDMTPGRDNSTLGALLSDPDRSWRDRVGGEDRKNVATDWIDQIAAVLAKAVALPVGTAGTLYGLTGLPGGMDNVLTKAAEGVRGFASAIESDTIVGQQADVDAAVESATAAEGQWGAFKAVASETVKRPRLLLSFFIEQTPNLMITGVAGRGAGILARVMGAGAKTTAGAATAGAAGAGAILGGADSASTAFEQLMQQDGELWAANETYKRLIAEGVDEEEAKETVSVELARLAGLKTAAVSLGLNLIPGALAIDRALAGSGRGGGSVLRGAATGFVGEGLSEALEEGYTQVAANQATQAVNPDQGTFEGAGEAFGMGALFAPIGGIAGFRNRAQPAPQTATPEVAPASNQTAPEPADAIEPTPEPTAQPEQANGVEQGRQGLRDVLRQLRPESQADTAQPTQEPVQPEPVASDTNQPSTYVEIDALPTVQLKSGGTRQWSDMRLRRPEFRDQIESMVSDLKKGGGAMGRYNTNQGDRPSDTGDYIGVPSENPQWAQGIIADGMTVGRIQNAVKKALNGERLGEQQAETVEAMLETISAVRMGANLEQGFGPDTLQERLAPRRDQQRAERGELTDNQVDSLQYETDQVIERAEFVIEPNAPMATNQTERRTTPEQRAEIAAKDPYEMTSEERLIALLSNELTGINGRRSFERAIKGHQGEVVSIDADNLKWIDDNLSPSAGDALLITVARSIHGKFGDRGSFHVSGDDFYVMPEDGQNVDALMTEVNNELSQAILRETKSDGTVINKRGLNITFGRGANKDTADEALKAEKRRREATGERAGREQEPGGVERIAPRLSGSDRAVEQVRDNPSREPENADPGPQDLAGPVDSTAQAQADSDRDRQTRTEQSPDMLEGDGDLFAGPRPAQGDLIGQKEIEPIDQPTAEATPAPEPEAPAATSSEPTQPIDDFGEKIVGARKDYADSLESASEQDAAKVPLSKSWPQPNYQKLIDEGSDPSVVALVRALRDEVPAKPRSRGMRSWANNLEQLRTVSVELLRNPDMASEFRQRLSGAVRNVDRLTGRADLYEEFGHEKSLKGIWFTKNLYSLYRGEKNVVKWSIEQKTKGSAYSNFPRELAVGNTREEAIEKFREVHPALGSKQRGPIRFDIYSDRRTKDVFIGRKIGKNLLRVKTGFDNVMRARMYLNDNRDLLESEYKKMREVPPHRDKTNAPRVGIDHLNGQDATPELWADEFGFRGVQFGNWVEQSKRQDDLNNAYDALMDLAGVIDVPAKALSLNGKLGLAFGARGKGGKRSAAAHYEPGQVVINLTKMQGAGSLAHEFWHSLDNEFGKRHGGTDYMTESEQRDAGGIRPEVRDAFNGVIQAIYKSGMPKRSQELDSVRSKDYWSTSVELSARAFEGYVIEKLRDQNGANDYLANVVSEQAWEAMGGKTESYPYPTEGEMPGIRAAFDNFFQVVETRETDQGVEMYSRREQGRTTSGAIIGSLTPRAQKALIDSGLITVTESPADWPGNHPSDAAAVYMGGKVYMAANNIKPGSEFGLILHEVGVHHGLKDMLGDKYGSLISRIKKQVEEGAKEGARKSSRDAYAAHQRALKDDTIKTDGALWEETIAYMAENGAKGGAFSEIVATIKAFLRKFKATRPLVKGFTSADVAHMARGSVKRVIDGVSKSEGPSYAPAMYQRTENQGTFDPSNPDIRYSRKKSDQNAGFSVDIDGKAGQPVSRADPEVVAPDAGRNKGRVVFGRDSNGNLVEHRTKHPYLDVSNTDRRWRMKFKRAARRYFVKEGLLTDEAFQRNIQAMGKFESDAIEVESLTSEFSAIAAKATGTKYYMNIPSQKLRDMNAFLGGEPIKWIQESVNLFRELQGMRAMLDAKSAETQAMIVDEIRYLIQTLEQSNQQAILDILSAAQLENGDFRDLTEEEYAAIEVMPGVGGKVAAKIALVQTIEGNKGTYLNRSYRVFDPSGNWEPTEAVVNEARDFLLEQIGRREDMAEMSDEAKRSHADGVINGILNTDASDFVSMISGNVGRKDLGILKRRKNIAPEIRALMGEHQDPKINFARSMLKMSQINAKHYFLSKVRQDGLDNGFLSVQQTAEMSQQITDSDPMLPMAGLWATPDFVEAMRRAVDSGQLEGWVKGMVTVNGMVKYGKTVLSPTTASRNFHSAGWFAVANGHINPTGLKASGKLVLSELMTELPGMSGVWAWIGRYDSAREARADLNRFTKRQAELGVIRDGARSGEIKAVLSDITDLMIEEQTTMVRGVKKASGLTKNGIRKFFRIVQKIYQMGDDFWKVLGFANELAMLQRYRDTDFAGMSDAELEVEAATRVRDTYPTYSMVPEAIQKLRRAPIGTFVSFPWEVGRTSINMGKLAAKDISEGRIRLGSQRLAGMSIAAGWTYASTMSMRWMLGIDDETDEAVRQLGPNWQRNSQLLFLWIGEDGKTTHLDLSHVDPYAYVKQPLNAVMNESNEGIEEKFGEAAWGLLSPFLSPEIGLQAFLESMSGQQMSEGRREVWSESDVLSDRVIKGLAHFIDVTKPGVANNVERTMKAIRGQVEPYGRTYELSDELLAWVGFRATTIDPEISLTFGSYEFADARSYSSRPMNSAIRDINPMTERQIRSAAEDTLEHWDRAFDRMNNMVTAARTFGMSDQEIFRVLRKSRISASHTRQIMRGQTPVWAPSSGVWDQATENARKDFSRISMADLRERRRIVREVLRELQEDQSN